MNFEEAVRYIEETPKFAKAERNKSGNENLSLILNKLGNPELKVKSIHIAGTNGKGSTVRHTMCILNCMGYRVGSFVSPHLEKINERISISEMVNVDNIDIRHISDSDFLDCFNEVRTANDEVIKEGGYKLSFFEMLFAIAALYFSKAELDYVIYETGLGGRLDATNLCMPVATAITSIGLDHTAYLGNTIKEIAYEKAGIIKSGVPVVYNTGEKEADIVIEEIAVTKGSTAINVANSEYITNEITDKTIDFSVSSSYYRYNNIILNANGALYQVDNAMTAIALCHTIFDSRLLTEEIVKKAVGLFFWEGRMERVKDRIIVDGAHNEDAILRFVEAVKHIKKNNINILFAVAADKDYEPMINILCRELDLNRVYVTAIDSDRASNPEDIADIYKRCSDKSIHIECNGSIRDTLCDAYRYVCDNDDILFCVGSLYLVGSIREIAEEVL